MLSGKAVLVTGAGRGLGRGIALALADAGARVAVSDIDRVAVDETATLVAAKGGEALALVVDVTRADQIAQAMDATIARFGALDGLVNNAGIIVMDPALEATHEAWRRQLEVNTVGVVLCCQEAARRMAGRGGAIVNIASNCGKVGYNNMAGYNASKAAVISLTRSLAKEWAKQNINVNAVCPGGVGTEMLLDVAKWLGPRIAIEPHALVKQMVPEQLGRHITPEEVGHVVAFLLSDRAIIIRGQAINVDGGDTPY